MRNLLNANTMTMRAYILFFFFVMLLAACKKGPSQVIQGSEEIKEETTTTVEIAKSVRDTFDCKIYGKVDKVTDKWIAEEEHYFAMTNDIFQDIQPEIIRYNVFQAYNTETCELRYNGKLPNKRNLIKPYRLQVDVYNPISKLICTQGPSDIYCYHLGFGEAVTPLSPPFPARKLASLDQEQPCDLDTWDNYLFGWTKSEGAYAFDMTNHRNPTSIRQSESHYDGQIQNHFFLLKQNAGKQLVRLQIINDRIQLSTIFDQPINLGEEIIRERRAGNYLVLKYLDKNDFVVYDLKENKLVSVPERAKSGSSSIKTYLQNL